MFLHRSGGTRVLKFVLLLATLLTFMAAITASCLAASDEIGPDQLMIDPLLLVALAECRSIVDQTPDGFYPGWDFSSTPVLFYKPGVQDVLINFPHQPEGFRRYQGFNPLGDETIYVRDGETYIEWDDQNTQREIDGVITLVVADPLSSQRNMIRGTVLNQSASAVQSWLDDWNFVVTPYDKIRVILHEAFHAYQSHLAPEKGADESSVARYPLLDSTNNALSHLEGLILRDALTAKKPAVRRQKAAEFVAVRTQRQSLLADEFAAYENLNEFVEGTAKYIEFKFLATGQDLQAGSQMYFWQGFQGYSVLPDLFDHELEDMIKIIGVTDDRFGNRFGGGPLRFKLYVLGAAQALLLDDLDPAWKQVIFEDNIYLCDLLRDALALNPAELGAALASAKTTYDYSNLLAAKTEFEGEGRVFIQAKVDEILETESTRIVLDYSGFEIAGMGYTPFGVTSVDPARTIYDMVPLQVLFGEDTLLELREVRPVLVDTEQNQIIFVTDTPVAEFTVGKSSGLEVANFALTASGVETTVSDNTVTIRLASMP